MPSFSNTLEQAIHAALALANSRSHEFATLEHLLLALVDEPDAARVMKACDVDTEGSQPGGSAVIATTRLPPACGAGSCATANAAQIPRIAVSTKILLLRMLSSS